jgi:SNF2 family DNA or RNA helicase
MMSGTPAPNTPVEFWPQVQAVAGPGGDVFNDNPWAFRSEWCHAIPIGLTGCKKWVFRESLRKQFMRRMAPLADVIRKADVLPDLPELQHHIRQVELSSTERAAYRQLKSELVLRFADSAILADSALKEIGKLQQIAAGFVYDDDGQARSLGRSKLQEVKSLLVELGDQQVIVWAQYRFEIERLLEELPDAVAVWGGCKNRDGAIAAFRSGAARVLVAHPAACGHGLNLTNASYAIYSSLNFSFEQFEQSMNRIHRPGQRRGACCYYLLSRDTIDERIYRVLTGKGRMSAAVLSYLRGTQHERQAIPA